MATTLLPAVLPALLAGGLAGCDDAGTSATDGGIDAGLPDLVAPPDLTPPPLTATQSNIRRVVVIVQENQAFDTYFGRYCTAATGSNPTCNDGPSCCEAAPATDPGSGDQPTVLDDAQHGAFDPDHTAACETREVDGGKMDAFVNNAFCGNKANFAYAPQSLVQPYWDLAKAGALADRYFQPLLGQSSANDMYFARAQFVFSDNTEAPDSIGHQCTLAPKTASYTDPTIADLLVANGTSFAWYGEGYAAMVAARQDGHCPEPPLDCGASLPFYPCDYDPSDVPFEYYKSLADNPSYFRDFGAFATDLASKSLPQVTFVKAIGYHSEHPGYKDTISDGIAFVQKVVTAVESSPVADETLVLFTYDEGGGFFDHVAPPPTSTVDGKDYGTRVPLLAIGPFARKNFVSHVTMEHSSIVRFIEWNFLGGKTGQLQGRDAVVNNIGSLLDPAATGTAVPE